MRPIDHMRVLSLSLIAIATLATTAACGSSGNKPPADATRAARKQPTATQAVTTTHAAAPQQFISHRYGFRMTLPKHWSGQNALVNWNGKEEGVGLPDFANFTDTTTGQWVVAAATRVPNGTSLAQWKAATVRAAPSSCSEPSSAENTTLGGEPALAWTATCSDYGDINDLAALHARRGYLIFLASPTRRNHAQHRRLFESIRRSFHFTSQ
jgi:predicted small lipoprotein YifL